MMSESFWCEGYSTEIRFSAKYFGIGKTAAQFQVSNKPGTKSKMGVGDMKTVGIFCRIACLCVCVFIFLGSLSQVQSQDLFRDVDQLKRDLSSLRNEVNELRSLVYDLRKMVLTIATSQKEEQPEKISGGDQQAVKQEPVVDEKEITRLACQAVGKFFEEADASLRAGDDKEASVRMREAMRHLNSSLHKYAGTHRVSKLTTIYDGLSYDVYVALELRGSIQGNQAFIDALNEHKKKYRVTCE